MQRANKHQSPITREQAPLSVVQTGESQTHLEREIDQHINNIRALIRKMRPSERQRYYNGLLSHILEVPVGPSFHPTHIDRKDEQSTNLSHEHLSLIREMADKMEQLYRVMDGYDPS
jgi:hypothetical protein